MSESFESTASIAPFICKWFDAHSKLQFFNTQEELENHVYNDHHKDLFKLKAFYQGCLIYKCPWKDCEKQLRDIPEVKEHLIDHTYQKPFKCPIHICSHQFGSIDKLNQHLIFNHNTSIVDSTGTVDATKKEKGDNQGNTSKEGRSLLKHDEREGYLIVENETIKYEVEDDEDYRVCKALSKLFDRDYVEKLKVQYGLEDLDF